jgi:hypothetical protein
MTPIPLLEINYFGLAQAFTMSGLSVHQTFEQDPEIYRFEFSDLNQDIHVSLFPLKGGGCSRPWFDGRRGTGRRIVRPMYRLHQRSGLKIHAIARGKAASHLLYRLFAKEQNWMSPHLNQSRRD